MSKKRTFCKRIGRFSIVLFVFFGLVRVDRSYSCTTFFLQDKEQMIIGKNYDWPVGSGYVMINKAGMIKTAFLPSQEIKEKPALWTSKYGSLTFNQFGREEPASGINETGLVVEMMMLSETKYPSYDSRTIVTDLQWIQYQLDNYRSVDEALIAAEKIRIYHEPPGCHFLICDKLGACAIVEFLEEKMIVYRGVGLPVISLTNSPYEASLEFLKKQTELVDHKPVSLDESSLARFYEAARMIKTYDSRKSQSLINYGFDILSRVAISDLTRWSIVYDIPNLKVHFRTDLKPDIKTIDLHDFDFSCKTPVKVLDINGDESGNVTPFFTDYTIHVNYSLISRANKMKLRLGFISYEEMKAHALYPDSTSCQK